MLPQIQAHAPAKAAQKLKNRMWVPSISQIKKEEEACSVAEKDTDAAGDEDSPQREEKLVTFRFITSLTVLCASLGLTALDYTGTGNIMGQIGSDLRATTTELEWIGNGYALASCVMQLPISALSDIFGRSALLMISQGFFFIGSVLSATAQNMSAMIAGRVIQGAGGAGCYVLAEVVLADNVPLRKRSMFYGVLMLVWAGFSAMAPIISGAFAQYTTWRWFFYMNLFISGGALLATPYSLRLKKQAGHEDHWMVKLKRIDYVGAILTTGSGVSLLLALSRGGSNGGLPWSHWSVILPLVIGVLGFVVTYFYEVWRKPVVPMFNVRVFSNMSATICYIHNVLQGIVNLCSLYYLPSFFQGAKGYSPIVTGACILPMDLVGPPIVIAIGFIIGKTGHYHIVNLVMWALATAGMGLLSLYSHKRTLVELIMLQIPASIGINCLYSTLSITANATNPPQLWTESTAMMSFFRAFGDCLGTAIGAAVLASQMRSRLSSLAAQGMEVPDADNVLSMVHLIHTIDSAEMKATLINVLSASIQTMFYVMTGFCAVSFVLTLLQKEYTLDQLGESKQGIDH